jgi:prolipoprotein diacylglyceryltransferase
VFGAVYGATRVLEDNLRVDKQIFGMTGSQWTGTAVSIFCITTLIVWAIGKRRSGRGTGATPSGSATTSVEETGPPTGKLLEP